MRKLVLLNFKKQLIYLYHNKECKAVYEIPNPLDKETVEYIRNIEVKDLA